MIDPKQRIQDLAARLAKEGKSADEIEKAIFQEIFLIGREAQYEAWAADEHEKIKQLLIEDD